MKHIDMEKFRTFSLLIGTLLLVYTFSGITFDSTATINPLGIPLKVKNAELIGWGLFLTSIYCMIRFLFFGIIIGLHPRAARRRLQNGTLSDGNNYAENIEKFRVLAKQDIENYFPVLKSPNNVKWDVEKVNNHFIIKIKLNKWAKLSGFIHDVDYTMPIIINFIASLLFILY